MTALSDLIDLIDRFEAGSLSPSEHAELVGQLAAMQARVTMSMMAPKSSNGHGGKLLVAAEAAKRLEMSADYLYRHADDFAFTRRVGSRLRFSSTGIDDYLAGVDKV